LKYIYMQGRDTLDKYDDAWAAIYDALSEEQDIK